MNQTDKVRNQSTFAKLIIKHEWYCFSLVHSVQIYCREVCSHKKIQQRANTGNKKTKKRQKKEQLINTFNYSAKKLNPSTGSPILSHRREVGVILTPRILWCILSVLSGALNANQLISLRRSASIIKP